MPLHVLGHIKTNQLEAEHPCKLSRNLGLADASRPGEQEIANWLLLVAEPGAVHANR